MKFSNMNLFKIKSIQNTNFNSKFVTGSKKITKHNANN